MRTSMRRRVLLLFCLVLLSAGAVMQTVRVRSRDAAARRAREAGLAAHERGDHVSAVRELREFIQRLEPDSLALLRFGQSLRRLPNADVAHLEFAEVQLRRCIALDASNLEARGELMDLDLELGRRTETIELANWFLARDPADPRAVRAKAISLAGMSQFDEALRVLDAQVRPGTPRLADHLLYLGLMKELKRDAAEILERARQVEDSNAGDARFRLVGARALILAHRNAEAIDPLRKLAELATVDAEFARFLLASLDDVGLGREAASVLLGLRSQDLDVRLWRELVRRLWQAGSAGILLDRIRTWSVPERDRPTDILGHTALALGAAGRTSDAHRVLELLRARSADPTARGWTRLVEATLLAGPSAASRRITACLTAIELDGANAQSYFVLGKAYRDVGEIDLAIRALQAAAGAAPNWPEPVALGARILAESGRLPSAVAAARAAEARGSSESGVRLLLAMLHADAGAAGGEDLEARLQREWARLSLGPSETLALRFALAASRPDTAKLTALVTEALSTSGPSTGDVLLAAASLSRSRGLGLEQKCFDRYRSLFGRTPALALTEATVVAGARGAGDGLALLKAASAEGGGGPEWLAAEASYVEQFGTTTEALEAWRAVLAAGVRDPATARAALDSRSIWADESSTKVAIDALRELTHPNCLWWRVHEARRILTKKSPGPAELAQATQLLEAVVREAPSLARARVLLADGYERSGEWARALDQWKSARAAHGGGAGLDVRIARVLLRTGDWAGARGAIESALGATGSAGKALPPDLRVTVASMLSQLGERDRALALLDQLVDSAASTEEVVGRAELYAASGEFSRAQQLIDTLQVEVYDPSILLFAAAVAELQGRGADATRLIEQVKSHLKDPVAQDRLLAAHYARVEDFGRASSCWQRVVATDAATDNDWAGWLGCLVHGGRADAAIEALRAARARGRLPRRGGDDDVAEDVLRVASSTPSLRPLGIAHTREPSRRALAAQAIRLISGTEASGASAFERTRIVALARLNPGFVALQVAVVDFLLRRREFTDAVELCERATAAMPGAPEPYRALAFCHRAAGRKDAAVDAARQWRARSPGVALDADQFLADLSPPAVAVTILEPGIQRALNRGMVDVLVAYARALVLDGRVERAEQTFEPALRVPGVATAWVRVAEFLGAGRDPARAESWLAREEILALSASDAGLRVELAAAWNAIASATKREDARTRSREALRGIGPATELTQRQWERAGLVHEANGDTAEAEIAYRRAVAGDPISLVAANNLAMLLARSDRAPEAEPLVALLGARAPEVPAFQDTIAYVAARRGDVATAVSALERNRKSEPGNAGWAVRIAEVLLDAGQKQAAGDYLRSCAPSYRVESLPPEVRAAWRAAEARASESRTGGK